MFRNAKAELELSRIRSETQNKTKDTESEDKNNSQCNESLDSIIKSIRTLTLKIPSKPEDWGIFFNSLERAYTTKNVPERYKAEILLNLLGDRASNILSYISDSELSDYDKVKKIVLREFEPTPQSCLERFRKTTKQANETHVQFSSRLISSFDYYLKLREVSSFEKLKELIVSDKLFQTLDRETASHISIRQSDSWFSPAKLAKEIDLYFVSKGRSLTENSQGQKSYYNTNKNKQSKNVSRVFLADSKSAKCLLCNEFHPLYKCSVYNSLTVSDRLEVIKKNNLCFNCLGKHLMIKCKSHFSCALCKQEGKNLRHHISLHFPRETRGAINLHVE